ncbi:MAG: hypothetical protein HYZ25_16115 [Chloroflexi bacterium]|nr:hypothetical protein [Chloroflexota bacterium]
MLLIAAVFIWGWKYSPGFLAPQGTVQASSTPASLEELTTRVENLETDQAYNLKIFEWKLDQKLLIFGWVALFISFAAGFLGLKTYNDLDKVIKERVNSALEKALYQLDPTNLPIHIYHGNVRRPELKPDQPQTLRNEARKALSKIEERLHMTGLLNTGYVTRLDKVSEVGITVVPIDDEEDEKDFISFINRQSGTLEKEKAGFILYAPFGYTIKTAMNAFSNTVIANMPATVASMVLVVGRGLKNREE